MHLVHMYIYFLNIKRINSTNFLSTIHFGISNKKKILYTKNGHRVEVMFNFPTKSANFGELYTNDIYVQNET